MRIKQKNIPRKKKTNIAIANEILRAITIQGAITFVNSHH